MTVSYKVLLVNLYREPEVSCDEHEVSLEAITDKRTRFLHCVFNVFMFGSFSMGGVVFLQTQLSIYILFLDWRMTWPTLKKKHRIEARWTPATAEYVRQLAEDEQQGKVR